MSGLDQKIVDVKDLFMEILFRWKLILLITVVITVFTSFFGAWRSWKNNHTEAAGTTIQEKLEEARKKLTVGESSEVEELYERYRLYSEYRKQYQENFDGFLPASNVLEADAVVKRVSYAFSSSIESADTIMVLMSLGDDDYEAIKDILPDVNTVADAYKYVSVWSTSGNKISVTNMKDEVENSPVQYVIIIEVLGNTKEISNQVSEVVASALQREAGVLKKVDKDLTFKEIGFLYRSNVTEYVAQKKQVAYDFMNRLDSSLNNLKAYYVDKLSANQLQYYNLLKTAAYGDEETIIEQKSATQPLFNKKVILVGVFLGLLISILFVSIQYIFSGTLKVPAEIGAYFGLSVMGSFFVQNKRRGIFSGIIRRISRADNIGKDMKANLLAVDVCGIMKKNDTDSLYVIQTADCEADRIISSSIMKAVDGVNNKCKVSTGFIFENLEQLQKIMEYKNALFLVHSKETIRIDMEKLLEFCKRHAINVIGAVMIEDI